MSWDWSIPTALPLSPIPMTPGAIPSRSPAPWPPPSAPLTPSATVPTISTPSPGYTTS